MRGVGCDSENETTVDTSDGMGRVSRRPFSRCRDQSACVRRPSRPRHRVPMGRRCGSSAGRHLDNCGDNSVTLRAKVETLSCLACACAPVVVGILRLRLPFNHGALGVRRSMLTDRKGTQQRPALVLLTCGGFANGEAGRSAAGER